MKSNRIIMGGLVLLCFVASCSVSELDDIGKNEVIFTAQITEEKSRMTGNMWDNNDEIGICMNKLEGDVNNRKFVAQTDGSLLAAPDHELYYPLEGTADFLAYYPYHAELKNQIVPISVADQSDFSKIDFLYSNNAKGIKLKEAVNLQFEHQLSLLSVQIVADETVKDTKGLEVSLKGMNTGADFNLADGTLQVTDSQADIKMTVNEGGTLAEAIVLPVSTMENIKMVFTLGELSVECPVTVQGNGGMEAGCKYVFNVTLSVKEHKTVVNLESSAILDWTEKVGGNIDASLDKNGGTETQPESDIEVTPIDGTVLFEETFGNPGNGKPVVNKYNGWTDTHGMTYSDPLTYGSSGNASIRVVNELDGHVWFSSGKNSALRISGFKTSEYKTLQLTYDITAYFSDGVKLNQNELLVSTDKGMVILPSKNIAESNVYQKVVVNLPQGFTFVQFSSLAEKNLVGFRLDNVKVVGVK